MINAVRQRLPRARDVAAPDSQRRIVRPPSPLTQVRLQLGQHLHLHTDRPRGCRAARGDEHHPGRQQRRPRLAAAGLPVDRCVCATLSVRQPGSSALLPPGMSAGSNDGETGMLTHPLFPPFLPLLALLNAHEAGLQHPRCWECVCCSKSVLACSRRVIHTLTAPWNTHTNIFVKLQAHTTCASAATACCQDW